MAAKLKSLSSFFLALAWTEVAGCIVMDKMKNGFLSMLFKAVKDSKGQQRLEEVTDQLCQTRWNLLVKFDLDQYRFSVKEYDELKRFNQIDFT